MIPKGKTGTIHGVRVVERTASKQPTVEISTKSADGRDAILRAAKVVYEQHHSVIQALANR